MRSVQFNEVDLYTGDKKFLIEENAAYYKKLLGTLIEYGYTGPFSIEAISTDNFYADAKRSLSISKRILAEIT